MTMPALLHRTARIWLGLDWSPGSTGCQANKHSTPSACDHQLVWSNGQPFVYEVSFMQGIFDAIDAIGGEASQRGFAWYPNEAFIHAEEIDEAANVICQDCAESQCETLQRMILRLSRFLHKTSMNALPSHRD